MSAVVKYKQYTYEKDPKAGYLEWAVIEISDEWYEKKFLKTSERVITHLSSERAADQMVRNLQEMEDTRAYRFQKMLKKAQNLSRNNAAGSRFNITSDGKVHPNTISSIIDSWGN